MNGVHDAPKEPLPVYAPAPFASEWETPKEGTSTTKPVLPLRIRTAGWTISDRLDRIFPPHKRVFGRSRRTILIAIVVIFLALLALIIGLAVGLNKNSKPRNLPLPNGAKTYTGDLTYYDPGLGACGIDSTEKEDIVAISHYVFDAAQVGTDPNQNPLCKRKIRAQRVYKGKTMSVDLTVVDRCTGCQPTDIDVSPSVFDRIADHDHGRVPVTWAWL